MNKRLLIVFLLGFSSGLPLSLITSTLQAWFSDLGLSILATGMLSFIGLPYLYRLFFMPILDRYALFSLGRRRSWILSMQLALAFGFNLLAWFSPSEFPKLMMALSFVLACCSSIQDAAIDAYRTEFLPLTEQGLGASFAVFGYRLALLVSGGLALVMAHYLGWAWTYRTMGLCFFIGVIATLWGEEPVAHQAPSSQSLFQLALESLRDLSKREGFISLLCFILLYKCGESFTGTMSGIVMPFLIQGLGFSLKTIGYVNKVMGISSILLGGLVAGLLMLKWPLYRALLCFGLLQACTNFLFVCLAWVGKNTTLFALAVVSENFAAGMTATALVALFMRLVNKKFTATQFSLLVSIATLPRVFSGAFGAVLQLHLGWLGLYEFAFLLSFAFVFFLKKIRSQVELGFQFRENAEQINFVS